MSGEVHGERGALIVDHPLVLAASILAGFATGHFAPRFAAGLEVMGEIYIDLLKMIVLPFMVAAVVFSLRKLLADRKSVHMLPRVAAAFAGAFACAALVALLAGLLVGPGRNLSPEDLLAMGKLAGSKALGGNHDTLALFGRETAAQSQTLADFALALIPANVFAALTQGETLKVMAFSLMFGLAVGKSSGSVAETLTDVLETIYHACLRLTDWFNLLLPVVLFAVVASQTAKTGLEPLRAMFKFISAIALGTFLLVALFLAALRRASGRPWPVLLRSQREPLLMALVTRSPHACMPQMIGGLDEDLGFDRSRVELLVPLGVSLVQPGAVLYIGVGTVFIAQLYDVHLGLGKLGVIAAGSALAGLSSSGMASALAITLCSQVCVWLRLSSEAALLLFAAVDPVCEVMIALVEVAGVTTFAALASGRGRGGEAGSSCPGGPGEPP